MNFVEDPQCVRMEQSELHGPNSAGGSIAAHKGTAEQHVLSADDDGWALGSVKPFRGFDTAHE
ncbi:MAG: hypothetical protein OXH63_02940, partial [Gemmatimonadetes bacterium]|nr:hypothetical protein [Gemmatimonadota bacterium]